MYSLLRVLLAWSLLGALLPARAVELTSGPSVEGLTTTNAIVRWATDVPCGTRVQFGLALRKLDRRIEGAVTNDHAVRLTGLKAGTRYFYAVGTARYALATNSFETPGSMGAPAGMGELATVGPPGLTGKPTWVPPPPPPARQTWGNFASLQDHFDRHGRDFKARSPEEYAGMAWQFLERAKAQSLPMKRDAEGVLRVFDPKTRAFAAYNRDGTTKTYFKPQSRDYFERQPGTPVDPSDLR